MCVNLMYYPYLFFSFNASQIEEVSTEWERLAAGLVLPINHNQDPVDVDTDSHTALANHNTSGHI